MGTSDWSVSAGIVVGTALILLGVVAYVVTDFASVTALIPSLSGLLFVGLGVVGRRPDRERRAVLGLGVLAVIGLAGTTRSLPDFFALVAGGGTDQPVAAIANGAMAAGCLIVLALAVRYVVVGRGDE